MGYYLTEMLDGSDRRYNVKIFEPDREQGEELATRFPHTTVIHCQADTAISMFEDENVDRRFGCMQWRMLFATMIGYTLFYFMRKNFSFAMPGLQQDCGISKSMLGNFLFWGGIVYGLSKFLNGVIGDRMNPKRMFCFGLLVCTLVNVAFGFAPQLAAIFTGGGDPSMTALAWTFGILLVVNQFFQAL